MVSIIAWTRIVLKSGFRFQTKPPLDVQASDAFDLPIVGYLMKLLCDRSPFGAIMQIRRSPSAGSSQALAPISGLSSNESGSGAGGWMSQSGYPERSWRCGCKSLHMDLNLSRNRLMLMMKLEPGALVPALGAASSALRLPRR
jgi:hypothetical protein